MKIITVGDLRRFMGHLSATDRVYLIPTQTGFSPVQGMFIAEQIAGGGNAFVLTDYDINADPSTLEGLGVDIKRD